MTAFATARALSIGATLLAALTSVHAQSYPVTATQRSTAQQVAQQGIPENELAPNAPAQYTVKRGDTHGASRACICASPGAGPTSGA
jgi:hypothetical protein